MIAFLPPFDFHIAAARLLQQLTHANTLAAALLTGVTRTKSPFRFTRRNEMLSAKWVSSHDDCSPFFTCFAPNVVESSWRVDHLAQGETKKQMVKSLFAGLQRQWNTWDHQKAFQAIEHEPCGTFLHQPSLIRGPGLWEKKTSLHHKGFHRHTVTSFSTCIEKGERVYIECGPAKQFVQTWCFIKQSHEHFNELSMKQFHGLMMAKSLEECRAHFPKVDGAIGAGSLDQLRTLMSRLAAYIWGSLVASARAHPNSCVL